MKPVVINAIAPTRICDVGGWTDTHFARSGAVFNIAIYPYVEVQLFPLDSAEHEDRIVISAENFGESYSLDPEHVVYNKHPLLEAAIKIMKIPQDVALRINIFSYAPPGASMGTSAAVSVALIGALDALTQEHLTSHEIAAMAHSIETKELGLECGIQDQLASAYGGINFIEMHDFPHSSISSVQPSDDVWWELEHRLVVTYIGQPHSSSEIHKMVIANLGNSPHEDKRIKQLRKLARQAKNTLDAGDLPALGRTFNRNTEVQRELHKGLVCGKFEEIISIAEDFHALGCKVNGAGGDGGSIAILTNGDMAKKRELQEVLVQRGFQCLPIYLSRRGLRVWKMLSNNVVE
ncbi:GHMP kinase [bacterium]|nr:GHMP kinase [bacterium]